MKKNVSSIMVAAMCLTVFSACSSNTASNVPEPAISNQTSEVKEPPIVLSIVNSAGGTPNFPTGDPFWEGNPVAKELEQKLNIKLKWDVYSGNGRDKLNVVLASGEYPDLIMLSDPTKVIADKIAIPLNDLIDKYGPDLKKKYGSALNMLKQSDGKIYHLTNTYLPDGATPPGYGYSLQVRTDIYEALGSPKLETADDVYNYLKSVKEKYPKTPEGQTMYPLSGFNRNWGSPYYGMLAMAGSPADSKLYIGADDAVKFWPKAPWALDVLKFYNKLFREGLIDPEAFTQDYATWQKSKLYTARVAAHIGGWNQTFDVLKSYTDAKLPNAENMYFQNVVFKFPTGDKPAVLSVSKKGTGALVITDKAKNPEAAMKLLNYLTTEEGNFLAMNGPKGIQWDMVDGKPTLKKSYLDRWLAGEKQANIEKETGMSHYSRLVGSDLGKTSWGTYWILKDDPVATNNIRAQQRDKALSPYWYDSTTIGDLMAGADTEILAKQQAVDKRLYDNAFPVILAKSEAEVEAEFAKFVKDLDAAGAAQVEAYMTKMHKQYMQQLAGK
ncbi:putative aldouronate transport system substrate-binding protein [Paenibacillus sp. UNCCL117]|uniref:extracellular solute-binding protein n=1 Tax=unclassified Paenibacillus TaxID=185978 RepID=UPI0008878829|nr:MULTISPECIES: extracellular solute-binding protein [unclassified Paenibacillus]SDC27293.1 putative aldouronate transport system substrate-binding protein [Paenibacillus sp. cl123]SFW20301.1 putative aldouronate transport system substrate-binding protein [Paenibacillus sp. UNCCL117]